MNTNLWVAFVALLGMAAALNLEIPALERPEPVCIRDFVGQNQLVVINVKTSGQKGDGQRLEFTVRDTLGNQFARKNGVDRETRVSFNSHDSAAIDICFKNVLERRPARGYMSRDVELEVESGSSARDWNALQAADKLKPAEVDLKKVHALTEEIAQELLYLRGREERMRDTNESTNSRVKNFSFIIILTLVGLGAWQIQYLRHYFKVKHII